MFNLGFNLHLYKLGHFRTLKIQLFMKMSIDIDFLFYIVRFSKFIQGLPYWHANHGREQCPWSFIIMSQLQWRIIIRQWYPYHYIYLVKLSESRRKRLPKKDIEAQSCQHFKFTILMEKWLVMSDQWTSVTCKSTPIEQHFIMPIIWKMTDRIKRDLVRVSFRVIPSLKSKVGSALKILDSWPLGISYFNCS